MNAATKLGGLRQSGMQFWQERNSRERLMLGIGLVVIVFALFYLLLIDPALSGRQELAKRLPVLRQQVAEVQQLARQVPEQSEAAAAPPPMTRESLEAMLNAKGLQAKSVAVTGELAKVQFAAAPFSGIVSWLDDLRATARVTVVDAAITSQDKIDTVDATLTLRQLKEE